MKKAISAYLYAFTLILAQFAAADHHESLTTDQLKQRLASPDRTAGDADRDAGRKPAEVLAFLGVKPGMTALDLMASGGWYTEVLSYAVGDKGKVYAHNSPDFLKYREGFYEKAISERLKNHPMANVQRLNTEFNATGLEGQVDLIVTALNFHDIYNRDANAGVQLLKDMKAILKPGGVLGLIDHDGKPDADNNQLHRMTKAQAIAAAEAAGFQVESSDLLANADDDHTQMVFSPAIRGKTDRFLLKLTKPQ